MRIMFCNSVSEAPGGEDFWKPLVEPASEVAVHDSFNLLKRLYASFGTKIPVMSKFKAAVLQYGPSGHAHLCV